MSAILAVVSYLAGAGLVALAAAWVRRPLPRAVFALFALVPLAFFLPDLVSEATHLPTDHMRLFTTEQAAGVFRPHNPWLNDLATQNLPWTEKVLEAWRSGELPLRDRWNGCGSPLLGDGPAGAFSPLTLLALFLPLARAFGVAAAWKLLLAFCGMWLWLRELSVSARAALFGAVSFALSFSVVPWLFFPIGAAIALWPWLLFAIERLRDAQAAGRAFILLVAVLTLWPLAGHIESVVSGASLAASILALRWMSRDLPDAARLAGRVAVAGLIAGGLLAFALLPQAFAILASNRREIVRMPFFTPHFSWRPHGFAWPGLATTLFPRAFGDGIESPMLTWTIASFPEMTLGYLGISGWAAALLVLRPGSRRARATWALLGALAVGAGVGMGLWPFAEVAGHLPVYRWMFPLRILSWLPLAGSAVAALELDRWSRDAKTQPVRTLAAGVVVAAALCVFVVDAHRRYYVAHGAAEGQPAERTALHLSLATLAAFGACGALALSRRPQVRQALPLALAVVSGAELAVQGSRLYRLTPAADIFPQTPLVRFLARQTGPFRVAGEGPTLFPGTNVFAGVEDVRTHDPVERRDYVEFLNFHCGYPPQDYFKMLRNFEAPALDFLNVRFFVTVDAKFAARAQATLGEKWQAVYTGADGAAYENRHVLPRVFAPRTLEGVGAESGAPAPDRGWVRTATAMFAQIYPRLARLPDWREKAFVLGGARRGDNGSAEVTDYAESLRRVSFHVRARGGGLKTVLVTSLVQDGGWSAWELDGLRLPTTLANGPFLALSVSDGEHTVSLDYAPPGWRAGVAVSAGTLAILAVAYLRRFLRRGK